MKKQIWSKFKMAENFIYAQMGVAYTDKFVWKHSIYEKDFVSETYDSKVKFQKVRFIITALPSG